MAAGSACRSIRGQLRPPGARDDLGHVQEAIDGGSAVIAWASPHEAGFEFDTCGANRRVPVDLDGFRLVAFGPTWHCPVSPAQWRHEGRDAGAAERTFHSVGSLTGEEGLCIKLFSEECSPPTRG